MDPAEVLAAFRDIEAHGWRLGAIVHSHPTTPATPSATDLQEAHYPEALLVIVGLAEAPQIRAWQVGRARTGDAHDVIEVPILVDRPMTREAAGPKTRREHDAHPGGTAACLSPTAGDDDAVAGGRSVSMGARRVTAPSGTPDALVDVLAAMPDNLDRLLHGQPDEALVRPASDGGWGAVENLAHMRDWEEIFLERARAIVAEDRPHLPAYDDELWAIERDYRSQDPRQIGEQFRALRSQLVAFLRGLPAEAWERSGDHDAYGEITLRWMINHICEHDEEHLAQVREALA